MGLARVGGDAAGKLGGVAGVGNEILEARVDALERSRLRVRDVAGDVLQRVGLRTQACDRRGESAKNTHYIVSNFDPDGPPVFANTMAAFEVGGAGVMPTGKREMDQCSNKNAPAE